MKKFFGFLLVFFISFFIIENVYAGNDATEFAGANFLVNSIIEENLLPYGVRHVKVDAETSTSFSGYDADGLGGDEIPVVPGAYYGQKVNVLEVPSSKEVRITSWANHNSHKWTKLTVRALITDFEKKNPGWKVIGAVNGDFFDINGKGNLPYQTSGALASNGNFYKTTSNRMVGFTNDGSEQSLVGGEPAQRTDTMKLAVYNDDNEIINEFNIDKLNAEPDSGETALYFAVYNTEKKLVPRGFTADGDAKVFVIGEADLALPNNANDFYGMGVISSKVPSELGIGQFALVTNNNDIAAALDIGVKIRCQYEFTGAYASTADITGCGDTIMKNGEPGNSGLVERAPRTAIGRKADGTIVMMVVDGRQSRKGMYGADRSELGAIMSYFGCVDAYNLDGGGSSTLLIKENGTFVVKNSPSDGSERNDSNCLLITVKEPEIDISVASLTRDSVTLDIALMKENGHDIQSLYFNMHDESWEITGESISFSGLSSNTEYYYWFYYMNSVGESVLVLTDGYMKTLKQKPDFYGITVDEDDEYFKIKVLYSDPDKASTIDIAYLHIGGKRAGFYNGEMKVAKTVIGNRLGNIVFEYTYNLNDGQTIFVTLEEFPLEHNRTLEAFIQYIPNYINDAAAAIYK